MSDGVYSIGHEAAKGAISTYLIDDVGGSSNGINRVMTLLHNFPKHGAEKALGSAIKRAATSGEAYAARALGKHYYIKAGDFKHYTKSKRHIYTSNGETNVDIEFRGNHIPLIKFNTSVTSDGRIRTKVMKSSTAQILTNVFSQTVGKKHVGLFERVGVNRYPIEEKFGPAAPQMMDANDDVSQDIADKVRETFDNRIEHEILAVMNGWRV